MTAADDSTKVVATAIEATLRAAAGLPASAARARVFPDLLLARQVPGLIPVLAVPTAEVLNVLSSFASKVGATRYAVWEPAGAVPLFRDALRAEALTDDGGVPAALTVDDAAAAAGVADTPDKCLAVLVAPPVAAVAALVKKAAASSCVAVALLDQALTPALAEALMGEGLRLADIQAAAGCRALALEQARAAGGPTFRDGRGHELDPLSLQQLLIKNDSGITRRRRARRVQARATRLLSAERLCRLAVEELAAQVRYFGGVALLDMATAQQYFSVVDVLRRADSAVLPLAATLEQAVSHHAEPLGPLALAVHRRFLAVAGRKATADTPVADAPLLEWALPILERMQNLHDRMGVREMADDAQAQLVEDLMYTCATFKCCCFCYVPIKLTAQLLQTGLCKKGCNQFVCDVSCRRLHDCSWMRAEVAPL